MRSPRPLQAVIALLALVVVATGVMDVALGPAALPGETDVPVNVDSNYRFFAAVWLSVGVALFTVVPRVAERGTLLRAVCGAVFLGGLARLLSIAVAGTPDPFMLVLLAVELVVPPALVLWHRLAVERGRAPAPGRADR